MTREEKGKGRESAVPPALDSASNLAHSLFSRLQSSLPANAPSSLPSLASFQSTLSTHISSNPNLKLDLPSLRTNLTASFQKLQSDLHIADAEKLAEDYLKKSEAVLRDAGAFLQDAVKVVPPPEGASDSTFSADGASIWTLPSPSTKLGSSKIIFAQSDAQVSAATGISASSVRAQRKDALLRQLRSDRAQLKLDPAQGDDDEGKEAWTRWLESEVNAKGGIDGDEWTARVWAELGPGGQGVEELKATRDELGERPLRLLHH